MDPIIVYDRIEKKEIEEQVMGKEALSLLYGEGFFQKICRHLFLPIVRMPFMSKIYADFQSKPASKKNILPFIQKFHINSEEFEKKVTDFSSFNDFFIRKLQPQARPITPGDDVIVAPADARYLVFPDISKEEGFYVKGQKFDVGELLQDHLLAKKYAKGSMVIARLAPVDYHRFHFPFDTVAAKSYLINGYLYSVNPVAVKKNIAIFTQNKRMVTPLDREDRKMVLMIEVGATNVGSIEQTYKPDYFYKKGAEKGLFSLGGSTVILLFEEGEVVFDADLIAQSQQKMETKVLMGSSLGKWQSKEI